MYKTQSLILLFLLLAGICTAQDDLKLVSSAGKVDSNNSIHLEWSIGEVSTNSYAVNTRFSEGFHQPSYTITSVAAENPLYELKISPNPTTGILLLDGVELNEVNLQVHRADGTAVKPRANRQVIDLSELSAGIYILTVYQNEHYSSFKIIKH